MFKITCNILKSEQVNQFLKSYFSFFNQVCLDLSKYCRENQVLGLWIK